MPAMAAEVRDVLSLLREADATLLEGSGNTVADEVDEDKGDGEEEDADEYVGVCEDKVDDNVGAADD